MRVLSIQVGLPREVRWRGRVVTTGIFKDPVEGPVMARALNLDGDAQADLTVHGGAEKAVYAYPREHYEFWRGEFPDMKLPHGVFGENFTTEGLLEADVNVGDRFRIGEAEFVATQPRLPCYKLGVRFGRADILKRFLVSRRSGFYFAVTREGRVKAGDPVERLGRDPRGVSVTDIIRLFAFDPDHAATMRRALRVEALPESWRDYFRHRLGT